AGIEVHIPNRARSRRKSLSWLPPAIAVSRLVSWLLLGSSSEWQATQPGGRAGTAESRCAVSPDAEPWVAAPRCGRSARDPLQSNETVPDPVIDLVRHSRSANCGCGSAPAATAKDTEHARVRAHRYGHPYRSTKRNSGAEQHSRDHQMPSRWSRCMLRFWRSLAAKCVPEPAHWVWAGDGECGVRHGLIVALRRGRVAHASATPRYLLPATLGQL
ncbi:MAG: hypothetical protein QOJ56_2595, partial [Mycobacterium sp.]|nr:hypothetical protein [Mycobacterium sp.]